MDTILRSIFGPSKEEIWRQLAGQLQATYVDGGFWGHDKIQVHYKEWTITLDTFTRSEGENSRTCTRIRAPYVNKDNFRFKIYRKGLFSALGKYFGVQDIEIGDKQFDDDYIIQGNDEEKIHAFFRKDIIRRIIQSQPDMYLEVKDDEGWFGTSFPEGVDELYFQTAGVIKDLDQLEALFDLFGEALDHLCSIGSAYKQNPGVDIS